MITTHTTLADAFASTAQQNLQKEAVVCGDVRLTYGQLARQVDALAYGLTQLGVAKGDRVGLLLHNSAEHVMAFFALAKIGAVSALLNPQLRSGQLELILRQCEPVALIMSRETSLGESMAGVRNAQAALPDFRHLIVVDGDSGTDLRLDQLMGEAPPPSYAPPVVVPEDLAALIYTSGTTGTPKGAMHSHRSLIAPVAASLRLREMWLKMPSPKMAARMVKVLARYGTRLLQSVGRQQTMLSPMGMHAISGVEVMLQCMLMGDRLVLMPRFNPVEMMELVQKERVSILIAVPMTYTVLLRLKDIDRYGTSSLLICAVGTAPCPPELARQIQEQFGCAVHIGFGTTELAGGVSATSIEDSAQRQAETVGQPMPGMEIKIVDEQGQELPPGDVGEMVCRGESVMLGYYKAPEATAEVVDENGGYHTGDLAVMDDKGYMRVVGRKKDMIIRGGQNIYPVEIERYLQAHKKIGEAAVVGVPATIGGEEVWAYLVLEPGSQMTGEEVLEYCRNGLGAYQIPHQVRLVPDLPRSSMGKPQKYLLREMAQQERSSAEEKNPAA
jgi:fatty-acyl-CoA synthase